MPAKTAAERDLPFLDPFASLREGVEGWAVPGAMADGFHLADDRPVVGALVAWQGEVAQFSMRRP